MKRQLAAILYADVAGYSRLTRADEADTHRKLDDGLNLLTETMAAHEGSKVHEAGDAILGEFPSVSSAVESAVEFQRQMSTRNSGLSEEERLEFRVGVNLGEVIHDRNDIYGDDVNLAARIQELAEPGGICISGTVYEHVHGKIEQTFDDLGYRKLKNISTSIRVYKVHLSERPFGVEYRSAFSRGSLDKTSLITGRCMCGDVRYEISQSVIETGFCHCRMCQRFNSAAFAAWAVFPLEAVRFTGTEPKYYKSSPIAECGFCGNCGSSLAMWWIQQPSDILGILIPSLDHPEDFAPTNHWGVESQIPWLDMHDDLPRLRSENDSDLLRRWSEAGLPDPADWK
jgi:class 3 adenylate cyclase